MLGTTARLREGLAAVRIGGQKGMIVDSVWRIGNTNTSGSGRSVHGSHPRDVMCQTRTLAAPEAAGTATHQECRKLPRRSWRERADPMMLLLAGAPPTDASQPGEASTEQNERRRLGNRDQKPW